MNWVKLKLKFECCVLPYWCNRYSAPVQCSSTHGEEGEDLVCGPWDPSSRSAWKQSQFESKRKHVGYFEATRIWATLQQHWRAQDNSYKNLGHWNYSRTVSKSCIFNATPNRVCVEEQWSRHEILICFTFLTLFLLVLNRIIKSLNQLKKCLLCLDKKDNLRAFYTMFVNFLPPL